MSFFTYIGLAIVVYYFIYLVLFFLIDCDIALALTEKFGKNLSNLQGKVVWIVDASTGIGQSIAYEVAQNNGKMVLSSTNVYELETIKKNCLELNPSLNSEDILVLLMNITETETHKACFSAVIRHFRTVDILINNGGKTQRALWEDIDIKVDHELFSSNVFGVISLSRIAVQYFHGKGKGHIGVITSLAGIVGMPYSSSYSASMHAIHGYFESLRNEKLGTPLKITLLCPGPILSGEPNNGQRGCDGLPTMSEKRLARLTMVALVNELDEAWMAQRPIIPLIYAITHFPNLTKKITRFIAVSSVFAVADGLRSKMTRVLSDVALSARPLIRR